jgi:succinate dehydrogenase / fumarate reductase cytochrome b subunit
MRLIDATKYRLPLAAYVSILHRVSGAALFLLLPLLVWLFDMSVTSEVSFEVFRSAFAAGIGFVPAWLLKLVMLGLIWAYLHHFVAGVRHLWMDATHSVSKSQGHSSAIVTFAISLPLTAALGAKLFGLF